MLVLTRKEGQSIFIGNDIEVVVTKIGGGQVSIGVQAPASVSIYRGELYQKLKEEGRLSSRAGTPDPSLEGSASGMPVKGPEDSDTYGVADLGEAVRQRGLDASPPASITPATLSGVHVEGQEMPPARLR